MRVIKESMEELKEETLGGVNAGIIVGYKENKYYCYDVCDDDGVEKTFKYPVSGFFSNIYNQMMTKHKAYRYAQTHGISQEYVFEK